MTPTARLRLLVQGETVLVPSGDLIDLDAERERLRKRLAAAEDERARGGGQARQSWFP